MEMEGQNKVLGESQKRLGRVQGTSSMGEFRQLEEQKIKIQQSKRS